MQPAEVLDSNGQRIGTYQRTIESQEGEMILISRDDRFGGGTIVASAYEPHNSNDPWRLPYRELSIREAPPYSTNVPLHAYFRFWERLGADNSNISVTSYLSTGSGTSLSNGGVPDYLLREAITDSLRENLAGHIDFHLIDMSVHEGTVLLEGYQNDTQGRLAAAEAVASVPGVKEIINMLVIRSPV